ncbi:helix-turn-helix domain-containing protein [Altibacter sp. HG106]|uniref:helix-turn-helix domain-containing protein n=1 Tax=Altibacter sp. HG106 TaxID=3023937 RepID=UPI0023508DE2|nr:helix-turn-helix transcriptional regulator [Altibacter sp. HG106]MDC7994432.1 helix-turn-helix transcriptional regulator [Altibacter sp. HG106]
MKQVLKEKGLKQKEFAEQNEISTIQLNKVLNDVRDPSFDLLMKFVHHFPDVDLNWLFDTDSSRSPEDHHKIIATNKAALREILKSLDDNSQKLKRILTQ